MRRAMGNGLLRAGSESPDQPAQMRRLIRPFSARLQNNGTLKTLLPNIKASDQTGWMWNVNWGVTVRICPEHLRMPFRIPRFALAWNITRRCTTNLRNTGNRRDEADMRTHAALGEPSWRIFLFRNVQIRKCPGNDTDAKAGLKFR